MNGTEDGKVDRHLDVTGDLKLSGIGARGATVHEGGSFVLTGILDGDLHIEAGGSARVSGILNGDLVVGGWVDVTGVLSGLVRLAGGTVQVADGAVLDRGGQRVVMAGGSWVPERPSHPSFITDASPRWILQEDGSFLPA